MTDTKQGRGLLMIPQCIPKKKEGKECGIHRRLNRNGRGVRQRQGCKLLERMVLKKVSREKMFRNTP
jgi:hypothetical protein